MQPAEAELCGGRDRGGVMMMMMMMMMMMRE
jgi:hypothetical protein